MEILNRNKTLRLIKYKRKLYATKKSGLVPYRAWVYLFEINQPKNVMNFKLN